MWAGARLGQYELIEELGSGGMGSVWRARHQLLRRQAAIKLVRADALGDEVGGAAAAAILRRFEREAQATSALRSPHTIDLYDFGRTDDGSFYYAMELLEGLSLQHLIERYGPLEPGRVVYVLRQACDSLAEAHHAGLIHRDVKPANIYLCRLGLQHDFVKVLDFGLVKRGATAGAQETLLTAEGVAPGSPAFMAPELARGAPIDGRTDLYALGCVAYWLLTGSLVFERSTALDVVLAHVQETPDRPSTRTELEIPGDLEAVVMACLQKDPADRPADARALKDRLGRCACSGDWSAELADRWWAHHKPAVTYDGGGGTAEGPAEPVRPGEAGSPVAEAPAGVRDPVPAAASRVRDSVPTAASRARDPAPADAGAPRAPVRARNEQAQAPAGRPVRDPIPTHVAFAPVDFSSPESPDPLADARRQMRSVLQRHFTDSRIGIDELERRLGLIRVADSAGALQAAMDGLQMRPDPTPTPIVEHPGRAEVAVRPGRRTARLINVFSGGNRAGRWAPASYLKVVNVFGGCQLDFRDAVFETMVTEVHCVSVFGGAEIIVPPDLYVEVDGVGFFGGFGHSGSSLGEAAVDRPMLRITGVAVFGGVDVKVKAEAKAKLKARKG